MADTVLNVTWHMNKASLDKQTDIRGARHADKARHSDKGTERRTVRQTDREAGMQTKQDTDRQLGSQMGQALLSTFGSGDLLQEVSRVLPHRALKP